jgi:ABC-type nitrate/sulfonate/bicarbonate transport system substrate-binding protein
MRPNESKMAENSKPEPWSRLFGILNFDHLNLFRISNFGFDLLVLCCADLEESPVYQGGKDDGLFHSFNDSRICHLFCGGSWCAGKNLRSLRVNVFRVDAAMAVAKARGLFAAEGLDITITTTPNSTEQMRGISKGTFDIASTAFDNVLAWSGREGAEIIAIAQTIDKVMLPVYVRPEIRNWNDLRGKKLAADAVDTAYALVLRRILLAHDLDLDRGDYHLVAVGAPEQRLESMERRETFAAVMNPPVESRETLVAFLRAWLSGLRWVNDQKNRDEAAKVVASELKLNPKAAAERVAELSANGALNISGMETVLNLRTQFGFKLPMGAALKPYYDLDYYRAAGGK